jgi:hypothetical protein
LGRGGRVDSGDSISRTRQKTGHSQRSPPSGDDKIHRQKPQANAEKLVYRLLPNTGPGRCYFALYKTNSLVDSLDQPDFLADPGHDAEVIQPLGFKSLSAFHPQSLPHYSQNRLLRGAKCGIMPTRISAPVHCWQ